MKAPLIERIASHGDPYLTRINLGHLRFHLFHRGDNDRNMHDHPCDFWTFPLTSYVEEYVNDHGDPDWRVVKAFRLHHRKAEFTHRVVGPWDGAAIRAGSWRPMEPIPTDRPGKIFSIVWFGRRRREWGFHTETGWVRWRKYLAGLS